jgi:hypothetical protein
LSVAYYYYYYLQCLSKHHVAGFIGKSGRQADYAETAMPPWEDRWL